MKVMLVFTTDFFHHRHLNSICLSTSYSALRTRESLCTMLTVHYYNLSALQLLLVFF